MREVRKFHDPRGTEEFPEKFCIGETRRIGPPGGHKDEFRPQLRLSGQHRQREQ
jgi:hypothetical protein